MSTARDQLQEQVRRVAAARRALVAHQAVLHERRRAFDAEHAQTIAAITAAAAEVDATEEALKAMALAHFQTTGEKKAAIGVEVKEREKLAYDEMAAFRWAKEHGMAVTPEALDRKAFEKIAKATPLGFVTVLVEPQAQISTDLERALTPVAA